MSNACYSPSGNEDVSGVVPQTATRSVGAHGMHNPILAILIQAGEQIQSANASATLADQPH